MLDILRVFVIILSLILPNVDLFSKLNFWIFLLLLLGTISVNSSILSKVLFLFSALYTISFLKHNFIRYLLVIFLTAVIYNKKLSNKWIIYFLYLFSVALFNHSLTPLFFIVFTVINFPEIKLLLKDKKAAKSLGVVLVAMVIFILIPFPDIRFDIVKVIQSKETRNNEVIVENKSLYVPSNRVSETSFGKIEGLKDSNSENKVFEKLNEVSKMNRERLMELLKTTVMISISILLVYIVTIILRAPKEMRGTVLTNFGVTTVVLLFFLFVLAPTLFDTISKIKNNANAQQIIANKELTFSLNFSNSATTTSNSTGSSSALRSYGDFTDFVLFIFQILANISGIVAIIFLGKMYYDFLTRRQKEEQEKNQYESVVESPIYQTSYSHDEILKLSGSDFIYHAYHYIRQHLFNDFDYMTPYELLEEFEIPELVNLSQNYVQVVYAFKNTPKNEEVERLKTLFLQLIEKKHMIYEFKRV
ncbi:hypothetical protein [Fervidobacterium sp.]